MEYKVILDNDEKEALVVSDVQYAKVEGGYGGYISFYDYNDRMIAMYKNEKIIGFQKIT